MNTFLLTHKFIGGFGRPTGFVEHYGPFETKEAAEAYGAEHKWLKEALEVHPLTAPEAA